MIEGIPGVTAALTIFPLFADGTFTEFME